MKYILYISLLCVGWQSVADNTGVLRVVKGDVKVKSGKSGPLASAKVDQNVAVKDVIITGADGWATVIMDDMSAFKVAPSSELEIRKYISTLSQNTSETLLELMRGRIRSVVTKKPGFNKTYEVRTPETVSGVRGTDFLVEYDAKEHRSQVTTFKGIVEFGQLGPNQEIVKPVRVTAGMNSRQERTEAATEAKHISAETLEAVKKEFGEPTEDHERHDKSTKGRGKHH